MSNAIRTEIRDASALAHYELSVELGEQMTYVSKGGTGFTVYGIPQDEDGNTISLLGLQMNEATIVFSIARQLSTAQFPPDVGICEGDSITVGTRVFQVTEDTAVNKDGVGAIWEVTATQIVAQKAGG